MDFYELHNEDIEEILMTSDRFYNILEEDKSIYESNDEFNNPDIGWYKRLTKRKNNIYLTNSSYFFNKNIAIKEEVDFDNISLYFITKGDTFFLNNKGDKIMLPASSNNLAFIHQGHSEKGFCKKESLNQSIGIHLSVAYFKNLVNLYPDLFATFFTRYTRSESFYLNEKFMPTEPYFYHIISQIENSHLMGTSCNAYVDAKILELLCLQFKSVNQLNVPYKPISYDTDKILEAKSILLSNIHNPPSVKELALKVGTNSNKLRQGFKEMFSNTVYGYLFDYKMELAHHLLLDTDKTIIEIATECGYEYASHFCTAFKRKFKVSPQKNRKIATVKNR